MDVNPDSALQALNDLQMAVKAANVDAVRMLLARRYPKLELSTDELDALILQLPETSLNTLNKPEFLSQQAQLLLAAKNGQKTTAFELSTTELKASSFASAALAAAKNKQLATCARDYEELATFLFERSCKSRHWDSETALPLLYETWKLFLPDNSSNSDNVSCTLEWARMLQAYNAHNRDVKTTFMHFAAKTGNMVVLERLLHELTEMDVDGVCKEEGKGITALQRAAYHGQREVVEFLVKRKGASMEKRDDRGRAALHFAAEKGHVDVVEYLLDRMKLSAALVVRNPVDNQGWTPLHLATYRGNIEVVGTLLKFDGQLAMAVSNEDSVERDRLNVETFLARRKQFLRCGGPTNACLCMDEAESEVGGGAGGFTALHLAVVYGQEHVTYKFFEVLPLELVNELVTLRDAKGLTAYDWVQGTGRNWKWSLKLVDCVWSTDRARAPKLVDCVWSRDRARALFQEWETLQKQKTVNMWGEKLANALQRGDWTMAGMLALRISPPSKPITISPSQAVPIWEHLLWAATQPQDVASPSEWQAETRRCIESLEHLWKRKAENILVQLVSYGLIGDNKALLQNCLMWAMREKKIELAIQLAGNKNCDLLDITRGSTAEHTPLIHASGNFRPIGSLRPVLEVMEQRNDIRDTISNSRQLYMGYINTLLVTSVLIAGLAFQSWLQPPLVDNEHIMKLQRRCMQLFVWFNFLGFFFAMAATVAGVAGAMPLPRGQLAFSKLSMQVTITVITALIIPSVVMVTAAFTAAAIAVLPGPPYNIRNSVKKVAIGLGCSGAIILCGWLILLINQWDPIHRIRGFVDNLLRSLPEALKHIVVFCIDQYLKYLHELIIPTRYKKEYRDRLVQKKDKILPLAEKQPNLLQSSFDWQPTNRHT